MNGVTDTHRLGRRGEALRRAVLDATIEEITAHGADATTIQAIASRAGVHETSIYRRWKTRENLILDALIDRTSADIPTPNTGSLRGDLVALARAIAAFLQSPVGAAFLKAGAQAPAANDEALHDFWAARRGTLAAVIDRAKERGELERTVDGRLVLEAVVAPLHFRTLLTKEPIDHGFLERLVDLVLSGAVTR